MILAGLVLFAVGAADLVRQFLPRRWIGYLVLVVALLVAGAVADALLHALAAIVAGAVWVWTMPDDRATRWSFWPAPVLALVSAFGVLWLGDRGPTGIIADAGSLHTPFGTVSFDVVVLVLGIVIFLLESSNLVVRAALSGEDTWRPAERGEGQPRGFQGGRLIGPLERVIVFMLTLIAAYPLLAAMLAAKGIVRFPEISKDGETGARAEYFLVGSLVSWVIALGAAFTVWWAVHT